MADLTSASKTGTATVTGSTAATSTSAGADAARAIGSVHGAGDLRGVDAEAPDETGFADPAVIELIELLFFAYRDFVGDADQILEAFAFGRAHHRVLYFVDRNPGMTVAELLDILKITKQSLGRVLRELIDAGFIEQRTGEIDRRQRRLFATPRGVTLAGELTAPQTKRIAAALAGLAPGGATATSQFLRLMINEADRLKAGKPGNRR